MTINYSSITLGDTTAKITFFAIKMVYHHCYYLQGYFATVAH